MTDRTIARLIRCQEVLRARAALRDLVWLILLLTFITCLPSLARGTENHYAAAATRVRRGLSFAIADFDGDNRPDFVSIQVGHNASISTDSYWIQARLSTSTPGATRLVAPSGGLLIEARDVNGDHAIDLVLSTPWVRRPIAILLNDGHGSFSLVEPTTFPGAFSEASANWNCVGNRAIGAFDGSEDSRTRLCTPSTRATSTQSNIGAGQLLSTKCLPVCLLMFRSGRAPPSEISPI